MAPNGNPSLIDLNIHIHGWDAGGWFSHQPASVDPSERGIARLLAKLNREPGMFHGRFACRIPGIPGMALRTTVRDLADCGLALVNEDGAPGGPIGALVVVPAHRRAHLRDEFAFGLVAYLSFLGGLVQPDTELAIHDYIEETLRTQPDCTHIFAVEAARVPMDVSMALSSCVERLSVAILYWLCAKDAEAGAMEEKDAPSATFAGDGLCARA